MRGNQRGEQGPGAPPCTDGVRAASADGPAGSRGPQHPSPGDTPPSSSLSAQPPPADASCSSIASSACTGGSGLARNKILVIGRSVRHQVQLLERIFDLCGSSKAVLENATVPPPSVVAASADPAATAAEGTVDDADPLVIPWTIDTKYYTAKVDFWLDACPVGTPQEGVLKAYDEIGQAFDAFVFVFDKTTPKAIDDLSHWLPFVDLHGPSITLCVGGSFVPRRKALPEDANTDDEDGIGELDGTATLEGWCIERGFEYIDLDSEPQRDKDGQEDMSAEKVGGERLLEALQTHLWEGLKRKVDGNDNGRNMEGFDNDGDDEEFLNELLNMEVKGLPDHSVGDVTDDGSLDLDFESFERTHNQIFGSFDSEDGLDHALESIRNLQEHSKSLPDAERKRLAAEVALSFAKQLEGD